MGATPRVGLKGAPSTPEGALSEPWGEVWEAHQQGPAWSACGSHSRPRGHQAQGAWDQKRWTPSCGNWCPLPRHPPGRVTRKNVTVNGGGSAGGRDTPKALARCGGRGGTRTHVIRGVEGPDPAQLAFAFSKPQSRQPHWASCPRPWQQLAISPQPVYHTSQSSPEFMGEPTGQPKCRRKSRELASVPSTRKRAGLWGSVTSPS